MTSFAMTVFERYTPRYAVVVRRSSDGQWSVAGKVLPRLCVRGVRELGSTGRAIIFIAGGYALWLAWLTKS